MRQRRFENQVCVFQEVGLMTMIRHKLRSMPKEEDFVRRIARRSFWMYLADKLEHSRYNAPMLIAIGAKMMGRRVPAVHALK